VLGSLGYGELLIILVIVVIFFGVGRLGEVGGAIGQGIREFRKASEGEYDSDDEETAAEDAKDGDKDA
jgi:sec-independent protein translocase protein TatA